MRTDILSVACISLMGTLPLIAAHPRHGVHGLHNKRAEVVVTNTVTDNEYVSYESEEIIIYVDGQNKPVSTSTIYKDKIGGPTRMPSSHSTVLPSSPAHSQPENQAIPNPAPPPKPAPSAPKPVVVKPAPKPAAPSQTASPENSYGGSSSSSSSTGSAGSGPGFSSGVTYTPYDANNNCKTTSQVAQDFQHISGYAVVRLYGTDCNQVANVIAATNKKVKIFAGIFDLNNIQHEVQIIASAVKNDWSLINTVSVGNELVNSGAASAGQVTAAIGTARAALKSAGYTGPVVTVDTMMAMKNNIGLCEASDFCAINCHAFFDGHVLPADAGSFVAKWAKQISDAAGGKTTVITESGWPTQGDSNNQAVPSQQNHQAAMQSLKGTFANNLILYSAYNTLWKQDSATTFNAEKYWGILGNSPSS